MAMPTLSDYAEKYTCARIERHDGILQVQLHSEGFDLAWGFEPHEQLGRLWADIADDPDNKVVILTGSGENFIHREDLSDVPKISMAELWALVADHGKRLLMNHLSIPVPMIAAVNGPATVHSELALMCDIVLAADQATFQDRPHFHSGLVPGDGVHVIYPLLLGFNRARYFLLTGQTIEAKEAQQLGLVAEVLPQDRLLDRAWELARQLATRPSLTLRLTREALIQQLRRQMLDDLGYGLTAEGLAAQGYMPESFEE